MTTVVTSSHVGPLAANGTTPIPFTFQSLSATEIMVLREGEVADPSTYTVSRDEDGTGEIIPTSSWGTDEVWIYSDPDYTQPTEFQRFGAFYPDQINSPLDRVARSILALRNSSFLIPPGAPGAGVAGLDEDSEPVFYPVGEFTGPPGSVEISGLVIVTPEQFGAIGDDDENLAGTDDSAAFIAAVEYINSLAAITSANGFYKAGPTLQLNAKGYFLNDATLDLFQGINIQGHGGLGQGPATRLRWADGVTGIRFQAYNTSGEATVDGSPFHTGANFSRIADVCLQGGYAGTEGNFHGIHSKAVIEVERCQFINWPGEGIRSRATIGGGGSLEGNTSYSRFTRCHFEACRIGLDVRGNDANVIMIDACEYVHNRQAGYVDDSGIGANTLIGCHATSNGISSTATIPAQTSHGGNRYAVKWGQETGASTNAPSGTTADNSWWYYIEAGGADAPNGIPAWSSGLTWRAGGDYMVVNDLARVVLDSCYSEEGSFNQFGASTLIVGGAITDRYTQGGVKVYASESRLKTLGKIEADALYITGTSNSIIGPQTGAFDNVLFLDYTNVFANITFRRPGVNTDAEILGISDGRLALRPRTSVQIMDPSNNVWATVDSNGIDLASGKVLKANGQQVLGARGAAVADAAAQTSVNATNAAAAPTQAEFNAFVAEFNKLRTDYEAGRTQLNALLARVRASTGHGLIA